MTYELAKQLKDAGFPQVEGQTLWYREEDEAVLTGYIEDSKLSEYIHIPDLSELLEACHTRELTIEQKWVDEKKSPQWFASYWVYIIGPYDTLEETLAYLWLRINKKG